MMVIHWAHLMSAMPLVAAQRRTSWEVRVVPQGGRGSRVVLAMEAPYRVAPRCQGANSSSP
jgi:hypothetical protein